jgi:hypothetical protein
LAARVPPSGLVVFDLQSLARFFGGEVRSRLIECALLVFDASAEIRERSLRQNEGVEWAERCHNHSRRAARNKVS